MRPTTEAKHLDRLIAAIGRERHSVGPDPALPLLVGLDGRSGVGKSTLAAAVVAALASATVIKGDEFYAGAGQSEWDHRSSEDKAALVIDWRRQLEVLETVRRGETASWHCYDWEAFDGRVVDEVTLTPPAAVVILEGAYSCRPELAEHLDLTVLVRLEHDIRLERLRTRDGQEYRDDWLRRWTEAEDHYFSEIRPPESFDLVLDV